MLQQCTSTLGRRIDGGIGVFENYTSIFGPHAAVWDAVGLSEGIADVYQFNRLNELDEVLHLGGKGGMGLRALLWRDER